MSKSELGHSTIVDSIKIIGPANVAEVPGKEPRTGYEAMVAKNKARGDDHDQLWLHQVQAQDIGVRAGLMGTTEASNLRYENSTRGRILKTLMPGLKWGCSQTERAQKYGGQLTYWVVMPRWLLEDCDTGYGPRSGQFIQDLFGAIFPHVDQEGRNCLHAGDCCGHYYSNGMNGYMKGTRYLTTVSYTQNV